ncbi:cysteine hydrolase family protein [Nocardioides rubriscoriae]|uniref:cysteine hydrolase family protein n=1 Tax=Nocardioides rubriscoriae TaxID=642762 RepID=UPI0011DF0A3A|nr:cysteine hydrolase family protein [Nocardioides rubriscoriae]
MISRYGSETALVVVDPQVGVDVLEHWGGPQGRRNNPEAEARLADLLAAWRGHGLPVVITRHESREALSPLRADADTCRFKPGLEPLPGEEVVPKSVNGAFFGTDLELRLRRRGVTRLVVAGFFTNMCVETTVRTAGNLGYDTYLAHDACATTNRVGPDGVDHDPQVVHALSVASLHGEFCTALATAALVALCDADAPELVRAQGNEPG